jgi:hypothetical protein
MSDEDESADSDITAAEREIVALLEARDLIAIPVKQKKTAEELEAMIHQDLSQFEGWPERGVKVTVYGLNPWNSMLTFGVDAGPVHNKTDLQGLCDIITERLKRLYDKEHDPRLMEARAEGEGKMTGLGLSAPLDA